MKVAIFNACTMTAPHPETDLELAERHLAAGDQVRFYHCAKELLFCDQNPDVDTAVCISCQWAFRKGIRLLSGQVETRAFCSMSPALSEGIKQLGLHHASRDELVSLRVDNFDIGWAALSSLISRFRDPCPDFTSHAELLARILVSALVSYRSALNHLESFRPDRVYLFNGRFANQRAVVRACEKLGISYATHDRGSDLSRYALSENTLPHDPVRRAESIRRHWKSRAEDPDRDRMASQFFLDRREGVMKNWYSFLGKQDLDRLPDGWDPGKINVAIYSSSEDEFAAIGEAPRLCFAENQADALRAIVDELKQSRATGFHIYHRMHPNLMSVDNAYTRGFRAIRAPFMSVLPSDSPVSSYALLTAADKVVTFGSTVGVEATYWGKPSILCGRSYYESLDVAYIAHTPAEVVRLMLFPSLIPKNKTGALMYGLFSSTAGIPYSHYESSGVKSGAFKGEKLLESYPYTFWRPRWIRLTCVRGAYVRSKLKKWMRENGTFKP